MIINDVPAVQYGPLSGYVFIGVDVNGSAVVCKRIYQIEQSVWEEHLYRAEEEADAGQPG